MIGDGKCDRNGCSKRSEFSTYISASKDGLQLELGRRLKLGDVARTFGRCDEHACEGICALEMATKEKMAKRSFGRNSEDGVLSTSHRPPRVAHVAIIGALMLLTWTNRSPPCKSCPPPCHPVRSIR